MTADDLRAGMAKGERPVLVDVRSAEAFREAHAAGALNAPLYAVKTKAFLKAGRVVLMNEGFETGLLEAECEKLRGQGFDAWALGGGLVAWASRGGALAGSAAEVEKQRLVSPRAFHVEIRAGRARAVFADGEAEGRLAGLVPGASVLPVGPQPSRWAAELAALARGSARARRPAVLVLLTRDGRGYERLLRAAQADRELAGAATVFALEGGLDAYAGFLRDEALAAAPRGVEVTGGACPKCP